MPRATCLTLRPAALRHNAERARTFAEGAQLFAMVKADGYGHGLGLAARSMVDHVDGFGVAVLAEAVSLRHGGIHKPIMLLQGVLDEHELSTALKLHLEPVVHSEWQVDLIERSGDGLLSVWLKVNTGMHRLGVDLDAAPAIIARLREIPGVRLAGVMTHLACADMRDDGLSNQQVSAIARLAADHDLPFSAANSAGLVRYPDSRGSRVRPGIMLYGSSPFADRDAHSMGLIPTQRLSARLIAINTVAPGGSVGYGATWTAEKETRVGVVSIGYGDGYPRHAPNGTPVAVNGQRTRLVGRVSMDMLTVDLSGLPDARVGDEVELWGDTVHVDEVARQCGTISYELFCQVTARPRRKVDGQT
jgi:alanine racemase